MTFLIVSIRTKKCDIYICFSLIAFQNLEINPQSCDAYGQMMSRASETTAEISPPSASRPDSGHPHLQERRDSYEAVSAAAAVAAAAAQAAAAAAGAAASAEALIKTNNNPNSSGSGLSDKGNAHYVAENQCLVKYYEGDAAIAVEEHFNRTLKESNEQQGKNSFSKTFYY